MQLDERWLPSFSPGVPYTVGNYLPAVLTADFNDDQVLDLATANYQTNSVSVLLGNGDGTFASPQDSATGTYPSSLAVGDFNEDGLLDLATGNLYDVSLLTGNGDGTFDPPATQSLGMYSHSVAVGDFNADGNLDLGVASSIYTPGFWGYWGWYPGYYDNYANVLLGNGTGALSWISATWLSTSYWNGTQNAAVDDFNGDGRDDFGAIQAESSSVAVLLANPDGSLGNLSFYGTTSYPTAVAAGDVNNDNNSDLLVAGSGSVDVRLGTGTGSFGDRTSYPTGNSAVAMVLGDFNDAGGDGNLDIAVAGYNGLGLSVLLGTGSGSFKPSLAPDMDDEGGIGVAAGDFDGDGWLDAARSLYGDPGVEVFLNDHVWPALDAPALSITDVSVTEGNTGTTVAHFVVNLSATSSQSVTVGFRTADYGATAGSDYQALTDTVTFAPGQTSQPIDIVVIGDRVPEYTEWFQVRLFNSVNAYLADGVAQGTILDDEPTVSIEGDVSGLEGNSGTKEFIFTVNLSASYSDPVTVSYSTADLTLDEEYWYGPAATAGVDYVAKSGTLIFEPGQTSQTVSVLVNGDRVGEWDELFWFRLDGADSAHIGTSQVLGTIQNDEPYVSIDYSSPGVVEGNSGTKTMTFTVSLSNTTDVPVTVEYTTVDGSALAGSDYQTKTGTATIPAGELSTPITVTINSDRLGEYDEYLFVNLSEPNGASLGNSSGYGYILDDEPRLSIANPAAITEGNSGTKPLVFTVTLSAAYDQTVTVQFHTIDGSARAGEDYVANSGTLTFAPGDTSKTITILINGDKKKEADEWFGIELTGASVNSIIWDGYAEGLIRNDDNGNGNGKGNGKN